MPLKRGEPSIDLEHLMAQLLDFVRLVDKHCRIQRLVELDRVEHRVVKRGRFGLQVSRRFAPVCLGSVVNLQDTLQVTHFNVCQKAREKNTYPEVGIV